MSVKTRVFEALKNRSWVSAEDFENMFPRGIAGHFSWPQRLRQLREEGYTIDKRIKEGTKHLFEYHLVQPVKVEQSGQLVFA